MPVIPKHQYFGSDLNVVKPVHDYIQRALQFTTNNQSMNSTSNQTTNQSVNQSTNQSLKALLVDNISKSIVGLSYRYSDLLLNECYLVESINQIPHRFDLHDQSFNYLIGCLILTPCIQSIDCLIHLLKLKRFSAYHIFFTDRLVDRTILDRLARADINQSIQSINELSMDYYPVSRAFFHLNNLSTTAMLRMASMNQSTNQSINPSVAQQQSVMFDRDVQGLLSLLRSLNRANKHSLAIRYASSSSQAQTLALQIQSLVNQSTTQSNGQSYHSSINQSNSPNPSNQSINQTNPDTTLLLILDRRDDPVTPLLTQWTYAAMVHELFGIDNNKVTINQSINQSINHSDANRTKQAKDDLEQLVLSEIDDGFFSANQHSNFGELGANLRQFFQQMAASRKQSTKFTSIEDMQQMLDKYPALRALSGSLTKHMTLVDCLSKVQNKRHLLQVSEIEQEIVCGPAHDHRSLVDKIHRLLMDMPITNEQTINQSTSQTNIQESRSNNQQSNNQSNNASNNASNNQSNNQSINQSKSFQYDFYDKLRVVLLYNLRYFNHENSHVPSFKQTLLNQSIDSRQKRSLIYIDKILEYYMNSHSGTILASINQSKFASKKPDLFETNVIRGLFKAAKSELVGIDNIFTQHKPLLLTNVHKLVNGDLSLNQFPFTESALQTMKPKFRQLIVYVVGGVCYEEYGAFDTLMQRYIIEHPNEEQDLIVGIHAPAAPQTTTSSEQSLNQSINQSINQSKGNTKKFEKFGADVFGAVRQVGGAVGQIVNVANVVLPKFNPREYRALIGGSCIHNSTSFLHEVHPIHTDINNQSINQSITTNYNQNENLSSIEAAVKRQNEQYRGRERGSTRGRGRGRGRGTNNQSINQSIYRQVPQQTNMQRSASDY